MLLSAVLGSGRNCYRSGSRNSRGSGSVMVYWAASVVKLYLSVTHIPQVRSGSNEFRKVRSGSNEFRMFEPLSKALIYPLLKNILNKDSEFFLRGLMP